jgi:glycosyltransferase involved in cell wall biosynthesis
MLKIFPRIREEFGGAELHIFRDKFSKEQKELAEKHSDYIIFRGLLTNEEIQDEFFKADVWLYPTNFLETFCLTALEALRGGCLCITTNIGSLPEVIGNFGILLDFNTMNEEDIIKILNTHFKTGLYKNKIKRGISWAEKQTIESVAQKWIDTIKT